MKAVIFANGTFLVEHHFEQIPRIGEQIVVYAGLQKHLLKVSHVVWLALEENQVELECTSVVSLRNPEAEKEIIDLSLDRFKR